MVAVDRSIGTRSWAIPLSLRLTATMVVLLAGTLLLTTSLNYVKFRRSLEGLADSRFVLVLGELGQAINASIAVGVPLNGLENVQYLLDQQQARDRSILSIDVADPRGRLLFSSVAGRAGQTLPLIWDIRSSEHGTLRDLRPGVVTLGQPVINAFNETLGVVLLRYSTAGYEATEAKVLGGLARFAGLLGVLFALLALLAFRRLLQAFRNSVQQMSRALETVLGGAMPDAWRPTNGIERQFTGLLRLLQGTPAPTTAPTMRPDEVDASARDAQKMVRRMFALAAVILVLPLALVGVGATRSFEAALVPEMHQKAAALARAIVADLEHAIALGIPLDGLVGPRPYFEDQLTLVPEARYIAVERQPGEMLYSAGRSAAQIGRGIADAKPDATEDEGGWRIIQTPEFADLSMRLASGAGVVHIGISRAVLSQKTREIAADVMVLSAAGLLITFEILLLVVASGITHPLALLSRVVGSALRGDLAVRVTRAGRSDLARLLSLIDLGLARLRGGQAMPLRDVAAANLVFIRTPLFFFCFAEELVRSFLPLYTRSLGAAANLPGVSTELLVGLPITLFMLVVAVCTPLAAAYSDRVGRRPTFLIGAFISAVGLLLAAAPPAGYWWSYWGMLMSRGISGIGYAAVFMACQGYLLDNTSSKDRAQGLSLYVGAIASADLCGPPIGGILADQLGFPLCFVIAAGLVCGAWILAWRLLRDIERSFTRRPKLRLADIAQLGLNRRLVALIVCASMPAKLLLTGFLFYLVPLHLTSIGQTPSMVGRVMMVYALGSLLIAPLAARIIDRFQLDQVAVIGGNALASASLLLLWRGDGLIEVVLAVAAFGVGQAISISSQITLVTRYAAGTIERMGAATVISVLRLFERLGAAAGPLFAGGLLAVYGAPAAMAVLGLGGLVMLGGLVVLLIAARNHKWSDAQSRAISDAD